VRWWGTSSLRRQAQIAARYPDSRSGRCAATSRPASPSSTAANIAAIILAAAGLKRLGLEARIRSYLELDESLPAAGQAALGIECLAARNDVLSLVEPLQDAVASACVRAERAVQRALGGSCTIPLGAYAVQAGGKLKLPCAGGLTRRPAHRARRRRGRCRAARRARAARLPRCCASGVPWRSSPRSEHEASRRQACGDYAAQRAGEKSRAAGTRAGGEPLCVPAIEILPLADAAPFHALAQRLEGFDLAIFRQPQRGA
jgi:hypothetical protein